jgi:hypothetical protein
MKKLIVFWGVLFLLIACQTSALENAREAVQVGDAREEAISILEVESWYHQPCKNRTSIDDLFFYGSHNYDEADIVIVTSIPENGIYKVSEISSFEPNAWHTAYRDCIDRGKFDN